MHTRPSEKEFANYGRDADVVMTIARSKITRLITGGTADRNFLEHDQAEDHNQNYKTLCHKPQLCESAASNGGKTESGGFLEAIVVEIFSREKVDNAIFERF